jgi:hypothetical protein
MSKKPKAKAATSSTQKGGKYGLSPVQEKYCFFRAQNCTMAEALFRAGVTSARAKEGVTGAEWERLPQVRARIADYAREAMDESELKGRLAAQARGKLPTSIQIGFDGKPYPRFDMLAAQDRQMKLLNLEPPTRHELSGPEGEPIEVEEKVVFYIPSNGREATAAPKKKA